jgi:hypothetical protein
MTKSVDRLLSRFKVRPILVDVGASGAPPEIWKKVAQHSIYVGFDPDLREIHEISDGNFWKSFVINEAVTSDKASEQVRFYLTRSPYCSSTLQPDDEALSNFLFSDLFVVESEATVRATSLDSVMERLSLPGVDWFKTDSQGTDLRLFNSLGDQTRTRILAVDIEPGLIDAYHGEDLFVDAHRELVQHGFWLSNLDVRGTVRMRRSTLRTISATGRSVDDRFIERTVKKTPAWCEARYLRTIEWLAQGNFDQRDYLLLWVFALLDKQFGFALDVALEYERVFGEDDTSSVMKSEPVSLIRHSRVQSTCRRGINRLLKLIS